MIEDPTSHNRHNVSIRQLHNFAAKAAEAAVPVLCQKLGRADLVVACRYIGVLISDGFGITATARWQNTVGFKWVMSTSEFEFNETVVMKVKHFYERSLSLPKCYVGHQQLIEKAKLAGQSASKTYGVDIDCMCP